MIATETMIVASRRILYLELKHAVAALERARLIARGFARPDPMATDFEVVWAILDAR
jgi:hypothetical protein